MRSYINKMNNLKKYLNYLKEDFIKGSFWNKSFIILFFLMFLFCISVTLCGFIASIVTLQLWQIVIWAVVIFFWVTVIMNIIED